VSSLEGKTCYLSVIKGGYFPLRLAVTIDTGSAPGELCGKGAYVLILVAAQTFFAL
jgi:hypothetical protein